MDVGTYVETAKTVLEKELVLPAGYSVAWAGQYEYMQRAKAKLGYVVPMTLAIIVILLYLAFRNLSEVLIIIGTLPFAMIGGIWLLYVEGFNFSVAVGVGFIALAGVAVEIGVIMLVYLNQAYRDLVGQEQIKAKPTLDELTKAVIAGAGLRVRPVVMTVATVMIGLLPVMYGSGTGSEVMSRIAAPVIGGIASALILSLFVVPAIYLLWRKRELSL